LLVSFFAALMRHSTKAPLSTPSRGREDAGVRRAQDFLNANYNQEVLLSNLASLANLSPYHFHRVFTRQTGLPPHAYQVQLRVARARDLLRKRLPIAHVAAITGFADQSHFTRHFKRLVGITPALYATT
jgi:transcriptional regulator GlxA family with amidase domain